MSKSDLFWADPKVIKAAAIMWCVALALLATMLVVMVQRNNWVYKVRMEFIVENIGSENELVSYDEMMCKFWIWDINKFIKQGEAKNG
jgi:MFS-type transporter involved in bile tolerance (Atg22 family)